MKMKYLIINGNRVIGRFVQMEECLKVAQEYVTRERERNNHISDTVVAIVLGSDATWSGG